MPTSTATSTYPLNRITTAKTTDTTSFYQSKLPLFQTAKSQLISRSPQHFGMKFLTTAIAMTAFIFAMAVQAHCPPNVCNHLKKRTFPLYNTVVESVEANLPKTRCPGKYGESLPPKKSHLVDLQTILEQRRLGSLRRIWKTILNTNLSCTLHENEVRCMHFSLEKCRKMSTRKQSSAESRHKNLRCTIFSIHMYCIHDYFSPIPMLKHCF